MTGVRSALERADGLCRLLSIDVPILAAPMAGACPPALAIAVAGAGGLGACGALLMKPAAIAAWAEEVRAATAGPFQFNLWIPDPPPVRDPDNEAAIRHFLAQWGPELGPEAGDTRSPDFEGQFQAMLDTTPAAVSSIMGVYPPAMVEALKSHGIAWLATVTTVAEAIEAEQAGADVIVAQGMEAGGHRGAFDPTRAERQLIGLLSLVPAVVDAVAVPVVAAGGIADARGIAAAFMLGAAGVQIGTGFLRCPEAAIDQVWADALEQTRPDDTLVTRAYSGRAGRALSTAYGRAASAADAPDPAPYPVQRALTQAMRIDGAKAGDLDRMQPWAGQSAALARAVPAGQLVAELWSSTLALLGR